MVHRDVTPQEAQAALETIARERLRVIEEIALPRWYWWGLALGWIALGFVTDLRHPVVTSVATLVFGAVHASVAARVVDGRHASRRLSVRADVAGAAVPRLVIGFVLLLAALTIAGALAVDADGARHPVTITSVAVAIAILGGGPQLQEAVRRRAIRRAATSR
jgi:hypothetical protein